MIPSIFFPNIDSISGMLSERSLLFGCTDCCKISLELVHKRAVLLSSSGDISINDIPVELRYPKSFKEIPEDNQIESSEKKMLLSSLALTDWNITAAAKTLGLTRSAMRYKINKYKLKQY